MIARRSFLAGILAAGAAPAIARAESLMRVVPVRGHLLLPPGWVSHEAYVAAFKDGQVSGFGLVRGHVHEMRFVSSSMVISEPTLRHMERALLRDDGRQRFLDLVLEKPRGLEPRPPGFSAESAIRKALRW